MPETAPKAEEGKASSTVPSEGLPKASSKAPKSSIDLKSGASMTSIRSKASN